MLTRFLASMDEAAYAFLRIVAGLMFAFHGVQKIFGVLTDSPAAFGTQMWYGAVIELVTGFAIASGIFTRWAAFLASGTMAVAYIQFHWMFKFDQRFFPTINKGELVLFYCVVFFYIACRGGGMLSFEQRWPT